jgi:flagellar basal-body rod modification protein FlgD
LDITATQPAPATPPAPPATTPDAAVLSSDFETFIALLTTQAKYQDPLEPIDSTEYASQLAQFSMVEQQVLTNDSLAYLAEQMGISSMATVSGWVGMEARAAAPQWFDGDPITISPNPAAIADEVQLVVRNQAGEEVQNISLPLTAEPFEWSGIADDGTPLPDGIYSFQIESSANGELILSEPAEAYGRIVEAQSLNGEVVLIMEGGSAVPSTSVTAIREPT